MAKGSIGRFTRLAAVFQSAIGRIGVRSFLFIVLSSSTVVPVTVLGVNQARRLSRWETEASDRQAHVAAQSSAIQLTHAMVQYVRAVETLAAQVAAKGSLDDECMKPVLKAHNEHHPEFLGAYIANERGIAQLRHANGEFVRDSIDYSDRDYVRELIRTHKTVVSRATIGRYTRELSVQIAVPLLVQGDRLLGLVCSSLNLGEIAAQAKQSVKGMDNGRVILIDGDGHVIADSTGKSKLKSYDDAKLALFAPVASNESVLRIGRDENLQWVRGMAVGLPTPVAGWRAIAVTLQTTIDAHTRRVMYQIGTAVLILILAALGISIWMASWIARPLRALAACAEAVTGGDYRAMPDAMQGAPLEMVQLTQSVRLMIASLREYTRDLESQVASRTEALSLSNQELTDAMMKIRENEKKIRDDIVQAKVFQEKMLPIVPIRQDMDVAIQYVPLEQVSGDIFDIVDISDSCVRIFLADATGHGVQASMRTILLKSAYDRIKLQWSSPREVLTALNDYLIQQFPDGDLHCAASCIDIRIYPHHADLLYANAANGPMFVFEPDTALKEFYHGGPLLGVDTTDIEQSVPIAIEPGQLILVTSDGLLEQSNLRRERFESALPDITMDPADTAKSFLNGLMTKFDKFRGAQSIADDVAVVAILFKGRP